MYTIKKDGREYFRTIDALLAVNLFSQLVQSGQKSIDLFFGKRLFASSSTSNVLSHGK